MGALCRWILLIGAGPLAAAGIGGTVTRADSAAPIDGATITAINLLAPGAPVAGVSDAAGQYALTVPAGTYAVFASAPGFASELFQEQPCCDNPGNATPIVLGDGETRTDVHFTLAPGARIHGMLRRRADATPLPGFNVRALQDGVAVATTLSDGNGDYVLDLAPGSYVVEAAGDGVLFDERYPDAQCAAGQCRGDVQAVSVGTGTAVTGIDLNLSPPARIVVSMGRVESGQSMDGAIWYWIDGDAATTPTRVDTVSGIATLELLGSGSLRVAASADTCGAAQDRVCLSELHPNLPCAHLGCDPASGAAVAWTRAANLVGPGFLLGPGATISGAVAGAGVPLAGATVSVYRPDASHPAVHGQALANATSDGGGGYRIDGLDAGAHFAVAAAADAVPQLYDGLDCALSQCVIESGDAVTTTLGATTAAVDFDLQPAGAIAGSVHDQGTEQALAEITVHLHRADGAELRSLPTDSGGQYLFADLPVGTYFLRYTHPHFAAELYDDLPCPGGNCDVIAGTPVQVLAGSVQGGIDAELVRSDGGDGSTTVVFLNRCQPDGCQITRGNVNDSRTNRSTITPNGTRTLSAFVGSEQTWSELVACVIDVMGRYRVSVTDLDPGNVPHHEAMIAGMPGQLGFGSGIAGVSPFSCGVIPNSITFTFANMDPEDVLDLCWTATHEIAHSFGLEHEFYCPDSMTYLTGCGFKRYTDVLAPVGTQGQCQPLQECQCGPTRQNAHQMMLGALGLKPEVYANGFEDAATTRWTERLAQLLRERGEQALPLGQCATMDAPADRSLSRPDDQP